MAKVTGFLEYTRELPQDRSPIERINDWNEFHTHFSEGKMKNQAARCMDCGIPFCHSGILLEGMASGCPINNLIPEWNDLIYRGLWREAIDRLHKTNNFPEFTGRVCPAPCEGSCTLGINEPPVTIKLNECEIIDKAFEEGWVVPQLPENRTGKKVAVIGSGPAGLSCAAQLNKAGHWVSVYEREDRIGGLLMYGIPNMKLDKSIVQRRVDIMEREGIKFFTNKDIGKDINPNSLLKEYDAVVLCIGSTKPRDLKIEGRSLKGINYAMDFLTQNTKSILDSTVFDGISAYNKDVIVIGGGDTGTDCVATSIRQNCKNVVQFEIMKKPPLKRVDSNPWPQWPKTQKTDYGQEEATFVFGNDPREYCISTKKFVGDANGHIKEVHTIQVEWKLCDNGKYIPVEVPGTEKIWPAQLVLICMGFLGPEDIIFEQLNIERDSRSNAKALYGNYKTNLDGVFAAGDSRRGQSLVVWAINEGRGAAREVDKYLMEYSNLP
ncbi:UNVERIFIED_CONTAM: glutamate synthase (NADPH/NADH) small chain [Acetivibrio alkalicellulosi]